MDPERVFHAEMSAIFHSVRDLHTNYLLPAPFAGMIAYLPFQVERYTDGADEKYVVTRRRPGHVGPAVRRRRRDHALERHADRAGGGGERRPLRRQQHGRAAGPRGRLADHPLAAHAPAAGRGVGDGQLPRRRRACAASCASRGWSPPTPRAMADTEAVTTAAASMGVDLHADETGRARALLYAPRAVEQTLGNHRGRHLGGTGRGRAPRCRRRCRWCSAPAAS